MQDARRGGERCQPAASAMTLQLAVVNSVQSLIACICTSTGVRISYQGASLSWTDNLADHLRLVSYDRKLWVYHHAAFLRGQKRYFHPLRAVVPIN